MSKFDSFHKLNDSILRDPKLRTSSQRIVYSYYLTRSRLFGEAWPSRETVARECGISDSTAKRAIKHLIKIGYLQLKQEGGVEGRFYDTNIYTVKQLERKPVAARARQKRTLEEQQKHDLHMFKHYAIRIGVDASIALDAAEAARITRELRNTSSTLKKAVLDFQLAKLKTPA